MHALKQLYITLIHACARAWVYVYDTADAIAIAYVFTYFSTSYDKSMHSDSGVMVLACAMDVLELTCCMRQSSSKCM